VDLSHFRKNHLPIEPFCCGRCTDILPEIKDLVEDWNVHLVFFDLPRLLLQRDKGRIIAEWGSIWPGFDLRQHALRSGNSTLQGRNMLIALLTLIGCQFAGELLRSALALPVPGPVIGMFLLAAALAVRSRTTKTSENGFGHTLERTSETLIASMGLLFVPAGVGIISEAGLLRQEWLPIVAALFGSTILGLVVTGLVMHWTSRPRKARTGAAFCAVPSHQGSRS
jgi:holin-like protein